MASQPMFHRIGEHVTRSIAGEILVVPIRSQAADLDSLFVLNDTGAVVWSLLDAPRHLEEIVEAVTAEFEVAADSARADVVRFLETLREAGLVDSQAVP